MIKETLFMTGIGALLWGVSQKTGQSNVVIQDTAIQSTIKKVLRNPRLSGVDPIMVQAMIQIESNYNPVAMRWEEHKGEASIGLMQILPSTARWLAKDMGYSLHGREIKPDDLLNPEINIYIGASFIKWLSTYKGVRRSEKWIVQSYNGGPNRENSQTLNHYQKYLKAKAEIEKGG